MVAAASDTSDKKTMKSVKQAFAKLKKRAQAGAKEFFSDKLKRKFFIDPDAQEVWRTASDYGCFTATSEAALEEHDAEGGRLSPTKEIRNVKEDNEKKETVPEEDGDDGGNEEEEEAEPGVEDDSV